MKRILKEFSLSAIAAVDRPCQEGAVVTLMKRQEDQLADRLFKQLVVMPIAAATNSDDEDAGSQTFNQAYADIQDCIRECNAHEQLMPMLHALKQSFLSILTDDDLDPDAKQGEMRDSVEQFLAAVRQQYPAAPAELSTSMDKLEKMQKLAYQLDVLAHGFEMVKLAKAVTNAGRKYGLMRQHSSKVRKPVRGVSPNITRPNGNIAQGNRQAVAFHSHEVKKRQFSDKKRKKLAATGAAMPDGSFPIESHKDIEDAVHDWGRVSNKATVKKHIIQRAKSLGATYLLPAGWVGSKKKAG